MAREWEERGYPSTEPHRTVLSFVVECIAVVIGFLWTAITLWSVIQSVVAFVAGQAGR